MFKLYIYKYQYEKIDEVVVVVIYLMAWSEFFFSPVDQNLKYILNIKRPVDAAAYLHQRPINFFYYYIFVFYNKINKGSVLA